MRGGGKRGRFAVAAVLVAATVVLAVSANGAVGRTARADLVVTAVSAPKSVEIGQALVVHHVIRNVGRRRARASTTGYYLNTAPGARTPKLRFLAAGPSPALKTRRPARRSATIGIPAALEPGSVALVVCADVRRRVAEARERNNCRSSRPLQLTPVPPVRRPRAADPQTPTLSGFPADPTNSRFARFAFTSSAAASFVCSLDAAPFTPCASPVEYAVLAEGVHSFAVKARNVEGTESAAAGFSWRIDLTGPPPPQLDGRPPAATNSRSATFLFASPDAVGYWCALDGGPLAACTSPHLLSGLADGGHHFAVIAFDAAGNGSAHEAHAWQVDTLPPGAPQILSRPAPTTSAVSAQFTFSGDAGATLFCRLDGEAYAPCSSPQAYAGPLADGAHTFAVRARDAAGNESPVASVTWTVARAAAPPSFIERGPDDPTNMRTATFWLYSAEPGTTLRCALDGGPATACANPQTYTSALSEGLHQFVVTATDAAGNTRSSMHRWRIDTTPPPRPVITNAPEHPTTEAVATFAFTSLEAGVTFSCWLDSGAIDGCPSPRSYSALAEGEHVWQVMARDAAGNWSPVTAYRWIVDTTAPPALGLDLGVFAGHQNASGVAVFRTWLNRPVTRVLEYLGFSKWSEITAPGALDVWAGRGYRMVYSVPMLPADGSSTLAQGAAGAYDARFRELAERLVAKGQGDAVIRLGWEFNGWWYPWTAMHDPAAFAAYWRRIVTAMRSVPGARLTFDWCIVLGPASVNADRAYPGDAYVDYIGMSVFDQDWYPGWEDPRKRWANFVNLPYGLQWQRDFAIAHGKRVVIDEWALTIRTDGHGGGDNPYYVEKIYQWSNAADVAWALYFEFDNSDGRHAMMNGQFPAAAARFKQLFGT